MTSRRGALVLLAAVVGLAALASCERASPPSSGQPSGPPRIGDGPRVVVLSPALARTMQDLGLARFVVGRHAFDTVSDQAVPAVGDQLGIDYERLLALAPTHVLLESDAKGAPPRLESLARDRAWAVRRVPVLSLSEVRASPAALAEFFANTAAAPAAERVARLVDDFDRALARREPSLARAGRVLLLLGTDPPAALGPGSFHHEILTSIGGTPALTEGAPFVELDAEDVRRLSPDAIVILSTRGEGAVTGESVRASAGVLGTLDIPAARSARFARLADPLALTPSTASARLADRLAEILETWSREEAGARERESGGS
jgi:ABC-type hemin transport system substrate-binding protein